MRMGTLPLDILLYIIDLLAGGDDEGINSLQILSQVCKSMVPLCRKHLFSSLLLHGKEDSERFSNLLLENPDVARYVTNLNYRFYPPLTDHELKILDILKKRSSFQSIQLSSPGTLDWNDFPESIRSSLVFLIQLPTVTSLDIDDIIGFPATALSGCSNLVDIRLGELNLDPPEVNQLISRTKISAPVSLYMRNITHGLAALLNSASLHAGGPIIDFSHLKKAVFDVESQDDIGQVNELIKVTSQLEHFNLNLLQPLGLAGLGTSFAINAHSTLKLLEFGVTVLEDDYLLCGFDHELKFIAGNNILEALRLYLEIEDETSFQTESELEDWSSLDSVLTESGAFPMLRRVSIEISWWSESMEISEREAILERLKEDKLPQLMKSKVVKFDLTAQFDDAVLL